MILKQLLIFLIYITKQKLNQSDGINAATADADQLQLPSLCTLYLPSRLLYKKYDIYVQ